MWGRIDNSRALRGRWIRGRPPHVATRAHYFGFSSGQMKPIGFFFFTRRCFLYSVIAVAVPVPCQTTSSSMSCFGRGGFFGIDQRALTTAVRPPIFSDDRAQFPHSPHTNC
jgi:hypothetical protein